MLFFLVATFLILGPAGVVMGQLDIAPEVVDFDKIDLDEDGSLSRDEAALVEDLDFDNADKDENGVLSEEEYNAAMAGGAIIIEPMEKEKLIE